MESVEFKIEILKKLLNELWIQSDFGSNPIRGLGYALHEFQKCSNISIFELREYFRLLIKKKVIEQISKDPVVFGFTEYGKTIKTELQIDGIINDVA